MTCDPSILEKLKDKKINWVTATSGVILKAISDTYGDELRHAKIACLSPNIAATATGMKLNVEAMAIESTMKSLVEAIVLKSTFLSKVEA